MISDSVVTLRVSLRDPGSLISSAQGAHGESRRAYSRERRRRGDFLRSRFDAWDISASGVKCDLGGRFTKIPMDGWGLGSQAGALNAKMGHEPQRNAQGHRRTAKRLA